MFKLWWDIYLTSGQVIFDKRPQCRRTWTVFLNFYRPPLPLQNCPFRLGIWTLIYTWLLESTKFKNPKGISIGSYTLQGLRSRHTVYRHRPTDRPRYSIYNNRPRLCHIYIYSTAMRPNNTSTNLLVSLKVKICENRSAYGEVTDKSMLANLFDLTV